MPYIDTSVITAMKSYFFTGPSSIIALIFIICGFSPASASNFIVGNGQIVNAAQTLNNNEIGRVETNGELSTGNNAAIYAPGLDVSINNFGSIITNGNAAYGILSFGTNLTSTNKGTITTSGADSHGIWATNANATVTNLGNINTNGFGAYGIRTDGTDAIVTNYNYISTKGAQAVGIYSAGANITLNNNGNISTTGDDSGGIFTDGDNAIINNQGNISTSGYGAYGILSFGTNLTSTNKGTIATSGADAHGIWATNANATVTNLGNINTNGFSAYGIRTDGSDSLVINSGNIRATGEFGIGIYASGTANSIINNTGFISAPTAILGDSGQQTLNLGAGSKIFGMVDLGSGTDTVNIVGNGPSNTVRFTNTENINIRPDIAGVQIGNTVSTVDPTGQSFLGDTVNAVISDVHQTISQRMTQGDYLTPVQVASTDNTGGIQFIKRSPTVWGTIFGSNREREGAGHTLAYDHDYDGFISGYEHSWDSKRIGFIVGYSNSDIETNLLSIKSDVNSYFTGVYSQLRFNAFNLTLSVIGGYEDYENDRYVFDSLSGQEIANGNFSNTFFSPSLTLDSTYRISRQYELRPSASIMYTTAYFDNYNESGTTSSNLSVDDRNVDVFNTRLQLAGAYLMNNGEIEIRVGFDSRVSDQDDVDVNLAGSNFSFATSDDDSVYGSYIGAAVRVIGTKHLSLLSDTELRTADGGEDELATRLRLEYLF